MNRFAKFGLLASACFLAACDQEPTGQVAAVVNGEEITLQEINTELSSVPIPEGADEEQLRQAVLKRIIDRRLLAQEAREDGLDQTPEFLVRRRQLEDALLIQLLRQKQERAATVPNEGAIDNYISENPGSFANRTIFTLDRIQFPLPSNLDMLKALEDDNTMDEVAATLDSLGINYTRGKAGMDSARLGEERLQRILAVPAGEPFVTPEGSMVTVAVITDREVQPVSPQESRPAALQALRNSEIQQSLESRLESARQTAEITYQEGFDADAPDVDDPNNPVESVMKDSQ